MLNCRENGFLNNSNFSKYGTIQISSGLNNLNTTAVGSYGTKRNMDKPGLNDLLNNNAYNSIVNARSFKSNIMQLNVPTNYNSSKIP